MWVTFFTTGSSKTSPLTMYSSSVLTLHANQDFELADLLMDLLVGHIPFWSGPLPFDGRG